MITIWRSASLVLLLVFIFTSTGCMSYVPVEIPVDQSWHDNDCSENRVTLEHMMSGQGHNTRQIGCT